MARLLSFWLVLLSCLVINPAFAGPKNPFSVVAEGLTLAPGAPGAVRVTLVVPAGHHVYRDMMELTVVNGGGLTLGAATFPPGEQKPDPSDPSSMREQFDVDVIIEVPFTAPAKTGSYTADIDLRYQGCKETLCYMPVTERVSALVRVEDGAGPPVAPSEGAPTADAAGGADAIPSDPVTATPGAAEPGFAVVTVSVIPGWHVNRDMMGARLALEGGPVTLGTDLDMPAGTPFTDPASGFSRTDLADSFTLKVPATGPAGAHMLDLLISYQACKEALCLMPQDAAVTVPVQIGDAVTAPVAEAHVTPMGGDALTDARAGGLFKLFTLVFVAGLGVSLTPCVLPMVPITIGIIGARSAGSRMQAIALAGTYVLGLALVYTVLGVTAGLTGMMFGSWMQNVWVVGSTAAFFFVMGIAMFGLFDIGMPSAVQTRLAQYGGSGFGGAFIVGMVGALVAGPCSGPVLLSIIALISSKGEIRLGAVLMAVFSLGMGMIFLVAGAFSSSLLRPGPWMETVKKAFGLPMWAGALYFASSHLPDPATPLIAAAMLLVTGAFAWPENDEEHGFWVARTRKLYSGVAVLVGGYLLLGVLITRGFLLPAMSLASTGGPAAQKPGIAWGTDEPAALARASAESKPVIIDFTAKWCAACKELEHYTYTDPTVISAAAGVIPVMIDVTDDKSPINKALLEKYDVHGLPTVKFLMPDGTPMEDLTVTGYEPPEKFLPHLNAALQRAGS